MSGFKHYVLQSNALSMQRLMMQHELYKQSSQRLLLDAGLKPGLKVFELGCGPGLMTGWLCRQLDENSSLTALDILPDYVEITRSKTRSYKYCQVKVMDAHEIASLNQKFDIIYIRMVLHHLHHAENVLQQAVACLNKKGVLICEEVPGMDQVFSYPQLPALERFKQLVLKTFNLNQIDYHIAYTMFDLLKKMGLQIEKEQVFQPLLDMAYRELHLMGLKDISAAMVEHQLIDAKELEQLTLALIEQLAQANVVSLYKMFQVIARKN